MSEIALNPSVVQEPASDQPGFLGWKNVSLLLAIVGSAISLFLIFNPGTQKFMLNSWIFGFIFWILVTLGCLGLNLLYNSIKGSWSTSVFRLMEAGSSWQMFLTMFICLIPVFIFMPQIYEWADPAHVDLIIQKKSAYLNVPGFIIRSAIFMLFWATISAGLRAAGLRQEKTGDLKIEQSRTNWATPGMVGFVLTLTFALTDWGMSLTPHWYSTIYGLWLMVGGCQAALSLCTVLVCTNADKKPYNTIITPALTKDLGNMMFVLTMLWGYTSVSQMLILWNGNLPDTASFYAHSGTDAGLWWNAIGMSTIIGCFVVPFVILNAPRVKRYPKLLAKIAGWIFVFRIVDIFWIIGAALPHRATNTAMPTGYDVLSFLTFGAIWFAVFTWQVGKVPLFPGFDRRLQEMKLNAH